MASSTIPEALQSLREKIASAYEACEARDAELPTIQNTANLAQAVSTIPTDYTIFDFGDGDLSSFNWKGEITYHDIVDAGLFDEVEWTWTKMPVNVTIGSSVTSIGTEAFAYCSGLMSIMIPDGVTSIGGYPFNGCTNLASVTIPDSVTSIGTGAFCGCSRLTSIMIPDGVTSIGGEAFCNCSGLTSITIPNSVMSIGNRAFVLGQSIPTLYIVIPTKTIAQVQAMDNYSNWGLIAGYKICCSDGVIEIT